MEYLASSISDFENLVGMHDEVDTVCADSVCVAVRVFSSHHHQVARSGVESSEARFRDLLSINANNEMVVSVLNRGYGNAMEGRALNAQSFLELVEGLG